jgi:hypothetical protein
MTPKPYCTTLQKTEVKSATLSYMDVLGDLPIDVKRLYWIYNVSERSERGNHAHFNSDRVMVCMKGLVKVVIENSSGEKFDFILDDPSKVLFFPKGHWINLALSENSILLVASSCAFKEDVLITDYLEFKKTSLHQPLLN